MVDSYARLHAARTKRFPVSLPWTVVLYWRPNKLLPSMQFSGCGCHKYTRSTYREFVGQNSLVTTSARNRKSSGFAPQVSKQDLSVPFKLINTEIYLFASRIVATTGCVRHVRSQLIDVILYCKVLQSDTNFIKKIKQELLL